MDRLDDKWALWKNGALVLLMMAAAVGIWGVLLAIALTVIAEVVGGDADHWQMWALYSLPLWAPFATGLVMRAIPADLRNGRL